MGDLTILSLTNDFKNQHHQQHQKQQHQQHQYITQYITVLEGVGWK